MNKNQINQTRFIYHTTATASSIVSTMYAGAMFGGPYGAATGLVAGFVFYGAEVGYDLVSKLVDELTEGIANSERALRELKWRPGF